ncbi:hypothetical protein [Acidovorax cavernicola]|uniref:Uncharacterized protein n=1 Tax=Acidovorax cavernicola TaxID=1675792 RepID=A0A9X8GXY2_9BURK|nr:hypothetical protein [Acidovorax cavernicola]RIX85136.1 hypothetical protein D3H34_00920 [Acidovorax cavernicola]
MSALNDLALTVEEREPGRFYWVLLEAVHDTGSTADTLGYRPLRVAAQPQPSYSSALALGTAALKKLATTATHPDAGGSA